jgi:hypothetical protein
MALDKTVTPILTNKTAAASGTTILSECTTIDTTSVISLAIEALVTYHSSATLGVRVDVYASGDDTNYGSIPIAQFTMPFTANTTRRWSRDIIPAEKYLKVQVTNLDTAQSATAIHVYAHAQTA